MSNTITVSISEIQRRIEEPLLILRTYLARAAYTMQDIDEDFFNLEGFDPMDKSQTWRITSQYNRNAAKSGIVCDALNHIKSAQLSLDSFEKWVDDLQRAEQSAPAAPVANAPSKQDAPAGDCPNIRKLAKRIAASPNPDAAIAMVGAIAQYGASVRAASKKKGEQETPTPPEKGGAKA